MKRLAFLLLLPLCSVAAPPAELATALEYLRDQKSYSWEVINADPGPVAADIQTMRGSVVAVQRNNAPNIKGSIDRNGDMLVVREWSDGLRLETFVGAHGAMVTNTPEGWMSAAEILSAQADERMRAGGPSPRIRWIRRADRPEFARPDQELGQLLNSRAPFEKVGDDTYVVRARARPGTDAIDDDTGYEVVITMRLRGGVIRDYEIELDGTRAFRRVGVTVPVSEHRIVVINYLPISSVDLPSEAREKLTGPKSQP